jgi:hypothetical membrane protein
MIAGMRSGTSGREFRAASRSLSLDWPRLGGAAAICAPAVMWTEFISISLTRPGYNILMRPASDLATRGVPHAELFTVGFFYLAGILTVLVGIALWMSVRGGWLWRLGAAQVMLVGVLLTLTGVFPQDPASTDATNLHRLVSQACFMVAAAVPLTLLLGAPAAHAPRPLRQLWLASGLALIAIEAGGIVLRLLSTFPAEGLFQRPFTLALTAWFCATGVWLLRFGRTSSAA